MSFSEKMRESFGVEGAKVEIEAAGEPVPVGGTAHAVVRIFGGTRPAQVETITVRVIEARRYWVDPGGRTIAEEEVARLADRGQLMPAWTRRAVSEQRVEVGRQVEPGQAHAVEVTIPIPAECGRTSASVAVTLNAQADIRGQIDPTGNGRLSVV
jgi:sporulation-control protein spo0M